MANSPAGREVSAQDVFELAEQLGKTVSEMKEISGYGHKTRTIVRWLWISLAFDIALTLLVTILTFNAISRSGDIHRSQIYACGISNHTRADERSIWRELVTLSGPKAAADPKVRELIQFVDKTFAPLNCSRVYASK